MRAIVIERPNAVALRDVETPTPGPGEVRVRSVRAGVCRTDLDIVTGALDPRWVRFPVVPGHEWSGVVDSIGDGRRRPRAGQSASSARGTSRCRACPRCRAGDTHLCESYDAVGFTRGGGWGEFVVVPARILHPLPTTCRSMRPCSSSRARASSRRSAARASSPRRRSASSASARWARSRSGSPASARPPRRRLRAARRGARARSGTRRGRGRQRGGARTPKRRRDRLAGGGLDVVVETAGAVAAVELSTRLVREGGRVVVLGIAGQDHELTVSRPTASRFGDLTVLGSVGYTTAAWAHMVALLRERARRPRPDRHAPLPARAVRGRVRAHGRPPGRRRPRSCSSTPADADRARSRPPSSRRTTTGRSSGSRATTALCGWGEAFCAPGLTQTIREPRPAPRGRRCDATSSHSSASSTSRRRTCRAAAAVYHAISGIEAGALGSRARSLEIPLWQLFGGRFRDRVRIYADCHAGEALTSYSATLVARHLPWMGEASEELQPEVHWAPTGRGRRLHARGVRGASRRDGRPRLHGPEVRPRSAAAPGRGSVRADDLGRAARAPGRASQRRRSPRSRDGRTSRSTCTGATHPRTHSGSPAPSSPCPCSGSRTRRRRRISRRWRGSPNGRRRRSARARTCTAARLRDADRAGRRRHPRARHPEGRRACGHTRGSPRWAMSTPGR